LGRLSDDLGHAYLARLGVDARRGEVDAGTLRSLHRAHLAQVPWETLDLVRGVPPGIEPDAVVRRIVAGRGGYCFHLNGAFAALLEWLGVDVTRHLAGVQRRVDAMPRGADGNHMALTARVGGEVWLVEVGLGDGPGDPLPLVAGTHEQDGFVYGLRTSTAAPGGWRLDHDPRGGSQGFDMSLLVATTADFAAMHQELSTDSVFSRLAIVQRRLPGRAESLRGCVLTEVDALGVHVTEVTGADEWWGIVIDRFGLACGDLAADERRSLWKTVSAGHEAWVGAGRP
jgi:arylamine N-acetyltransferase